MAAEAAASGNLGLKNLTEKPEKPEKPHDFFGELAFPTTMTESERTRDEAAKKKGEEQKKSFEEIAHITSQTATPEERAKLDAQDSRMAVRKALDLGVIDAKTAADKKKQIETNLAKDIKKIREDEFKQKAQVIASEVSTYAGMAGKIIQIADNMAQVQLNNVENQKKAETEAVEHSHMSAQAKQKKIDQINAQAAAKEKEINKQKQEWSIAQAIIGGAVAIVQGYAQNGPILGTIEAVLTAAVTASEIAVIASQKFASGGIVQGPTSGDRVPIMANGGEVVLNSTQQANTLMAIARGNASSSANTNQHISTGDIIIHGNASQATVNQIRQSQLDQVKQLKRTMQQAQRLRQVA